MAVTANKNPISEFSAEKLSQPDEIPAILQGLLVVYPDTPVIKQVRTKAIMTKKFVKYSNKYIQEYGQTKC